MSKRYRQELVLKAQGVARTLSYNDPKTADAKHVILEMSRELMRDPRDHRVVKERGGLQVASASGQSRPLTFKERLAYKIFKSIPREI